MFSSLWSVFPRELIEVAADMRTTAYVVKKIAIGINIILTSMSSVMSNPKRRAEHMMLEVEETDNIKYLEKSSKATKIDRIKL